MIYLLWQEFATSRVKPWRIHFEQLLYCIKYPWYHRYNIKALINRHLIRFPCHQPPPPSHLTPTKSPIPPSILTSLTQNKSCSGKIKKLLNNIHDSDRFSICFCGRVEVVFLAGCCCCIVAYHRAIAWQRSHLYFIAITAYLIAIIRCGRAIEVRLPNSAGKE